MKRIYFFFIIFLISQSVFSQTYSDSVTAIVKAERFIPFLTGDTVQFDLNIINTCNDVTTTTFRWDAWSNATIQFGFDDSNFIVNPNNISIEFIRDSSDVPNIETGLPGNQIPTDIYYMTPRIFDGRISITIIGPEKYDDCKVINYGDTMRIGTFYLTSNQGIIPYHKIKFMTTTDADPYFYYQALAAKVNNEVKIRDTKWYNPDDNIELNNSALDTKVDYIIDLDMPPMIVDTFYVSYAGQKKDTIVWITSSEPVHKGFILKRKLVSYGTKYEDDKNDFIDVVGRWDVQRKPADTLLIGRITHMYGYDYRYEFDTVPYRDEKYCYELSYTDLADSVHRLDTACIDIPDVLIYEAKSVPNPFSENTKVIFRLEEAAYVTCMVYDIEGRVVAKILENEPLGVGLHTNFEFKAEVFAPQGLYDIVIYAIPQEKMPIQKGRAVIKAQLIR